MTKSYVVEIMRCATSTKRIHVEAASMDDAERIAREKAPNMEFSTSESDYEVLGVSEIQDAQKIKKQSGQAG